MSVRIRVSYTEDEELAGVIRMLSPLGVSWKRQPKKGRYMRAYSVTKRERSVNEARANPEKILRAEQRANREKSFICDICDTLKRGSIKTS